MYKAKLTNDQRDAIKRGHTPTLISHLEEVDKILIRELKNQKGDVKFQQGASFIVDQLLDILKST